MKEDAPKTLGKKELNELIEKVRNRKNQEIWFVGKNSPYKPLKIEDLAIMELAVITYESQEKLNKLTLTLIILTIILIILTAILAFEAFIS